MAQRAQPNYPESESKASAQSFQSNAEQENFEELKRDFKNLSDRLVRFGTDRSKDLLDDLKVKMEDAQSTANQTRKAVEERIGTRPLSSVMIAFALGAVIAWIFAWGKDK